MATRNNNTSKGVSSIWVLTAMLWHLFLAFGPSWPYLVLAEPPRRLDGPITAPSPTSSCDEFLPQQSQTFVESSDYSKFSLIGGGGNYCFQDGQQLTQEMASSATWCRAYSKQECKEWCESENCPGVLWRDSGGTCHLKADGSDLSLRVPSGCCSDHHVSLCARVQVPLPNGNDQNTDSAMTNMAGSRWLVIAMLPIWFCTVLIQI